MTVSNGQLANQSTFNNAFLSTSANNIALGTQEFQNTTNATSPSTGAVKLLGGMGIAQDLWIGGIFNVAGAVTLQSTLAVTGAISGANLSGTNTGDVTLGNVGASPNSKGASITGQAINLQPADGSNPGVVTAGTQTIGGNKTFSGNVIVQGDFTVQGTMTSVDSVNLEVTDQNVLINKGGNDATAEGAGISVKRTTTDASFVFDSSLASLWKIGLVGSEKEVVVSGVAQSINGNKTFNNQVQFNDPVFVETQNISTAGSDQTLTPPDFIGRLTGALTSVVGLTAPSSRQLVIIVNASGGSIVVKNDTIATAANRILTGTGADLTLTDGASLWLAYDTVSSRWRIIGGSGAGGSSSYDVFDSSAQSISSGGTISLDATKKRQVRQIQGNAGPQTTSTTPFGSGPFTDGQEIVLVGRGNTVSIPYNDASNGVIGNFETLDLSTGEFAKLVYLTSLSRFLASKGAL